ncbi:zinc finger protein 143-like isoform X2 [Macrobrachium rosenbergii]|uniref:zinc finger protein 143-like isoform X2 n=1 Tax=Macrobrachium rosenbergii TaxID=79674 RepID=UPI0034D73BE5
MNKEGITVSTLMTGEAGELIEDGTEQASVVVVAEGGGAVKVELPDGTQAIVHSALGEDHTENMEGMAVQLEDGRIGYIYSDALLQEVSENDTHQDQDPLFIENSNGKPNGKLLCNYPNCDKLYTNIGHLRIHQRTHTGTKEHECEICKKAFTTGYALKSHIRTHTGEKPYQCPEEQCGKCFKTSGDLQKHVRTHTGERPFKCQICSKSFTTSNIRKVHMRVHTGEKPYACQYEGCDRRFASATNFRNHCRIHTGEKPYVCSIGNCSKRFTEYSSLYKHHMVHSQPKSYYCAQCGRFYRQLSTLNQHRKTAHNIIENDEGHLIWMGQNLPVGFLTDDQGGTQDGTAVLNPATSSNTKTIRITSDIDMKKENQILPETILNSHFLEDEVEVTNVHLSGDTLIQDSQGSTLTSLELDESSNGSILVLTDPSQLAALQQLAVASSSTDSADDSVKVISFDDFTTVAESTITEGLDGGEIKQEDISCNTSEPETSCA